MGKWADLPNELLHRIVNLLGKESSKAGWVFVNKQCFRIFLARRFKDTSINLVSSDKTLQNIFHSVSRPGQYVKSVEFKSFATPPASLGELNLEADLLYQLMSQPPSVKNIKFKDG